MPEVLEKPSLDAVRARLIQERLGDRGGESTTLPRIFATGRTGSGKSALGNLLLGTASVLPSEERMDVTNAVHVVRFPRGLTYVDIPGIASDDLLENYNRAAIGLPQSPDWPQVEQVEVIEYDWLQRVREGLYPAGSALAVTGRPDLLMYLIAPHRLITRDERTYIRDILRHYGPDRIVYVLNLFHAQSGEQLTTEENLADALDVLGSCHRRAGVELDLTRVVTMDCQTGSGLHGLIDTLQSALGPERGSPLAEVINYQVEVTPQMYRDETKAAAIRYAAPVAPTVPASEEEGRDHLLKEGQKLTEYAAELAEHGVQLPPTAERQFQDLVSEVIDELRIEHSEPVFREVSKPVYRKEPVYTEREENDYSRPITRSVSRRRRRDPQDFDDLLNSLGNWFGGDGFGVYDTSHEEETVGYETRLVTEVTSYRDVVDHTEMYRVQDGTRKVLAGYLPFGASGIAVLLAIWYAALLFVPPEARDSVDVTGVYARVRAALARVAPGKTDQLPADLLLAHAADILPAETDQRLAALITVPWEDSVPAPGSGPDVHRRGDFAPGSEEPGDGGGGTAASGYPSDDSARPRYLLAECMDVVPVGRPFSLTARIVEDSLGLTTLLKHFPVPPDGQDVRLDLYALGLRILGDHQRTVHVPPTGNSEPVAFELRADREGPYSLRVQAWIGGTYLGELRVEISAEHSPKSFQSRQFNTVINAESVDGAVGLVVRHDPAENRYYFEFHDEDYPDQVISKLSFEPRERIEGLVAKLDSMADGSSGYTRYQAKDYLINAGVKLWRELVPAELRKQFWERQHRIRQLTIIADKDTVPWELMYPMEKDKDAGFLVQQFPVTRGIFHNVPSTSLGLWPPRFVLPQGSLTEATAEIDAVRRLLDPAQPPDKVITELTALLDMLKSGDFGLLHFACHNEYRPAADASVPIGKSQFEQTFLETLTIARALERMKPIVFMNACRSARAAATYNELDGWAHNFLKAGAGAFIGALWAVTDGTAREFAEELYGQLKAGATLGEAMMSARGKAATHADDPTWLAYSIYGDPRAFVRREP